MNHTPYGLDQPTVDWVNAIIEGECLPVVVSILEHSVGRQVFGNSVSSEIMRNSMFKGHTEYLLGWVRSIRHLGIDIPEAALSPRFMR